MKKIISFVLIICVVSILSSVSIAAEYKVKNGEVIGIIAEKIDCSVINLAEFNGISGPGYVIRKSQILKHVSAQDLKDARKWAMEYLEANDSKNEDYGDVQQIIADIDAKTIEYGRGKQYTHASEIIILADTLRAR